MRVLGGLTLWELSRRLGQEIVQDDILDRAASLSYYFLFALFPSLLFLTALLGLLPGANLMQTLMDYAASVLPGDAASLVHRTLDEVVAGASRGLVSVGVLVALWAASSGTVSIITALNVVYGITTRRPWWRQRLVALALTLALSVLTLAGLLLFVFGERIGEAVATWVGLGHVFTVVWNVLRWPAAVLFVLTGITFVYYLAPTARHRWRWITPGSVFALVAWLTMSMALRLYVGYFGGYNATYGSIGGVILLLLWLYLSGVALLVGAEIDSTVERARSGRRG